MAEKTMKSGPEVKLKWRQLSPTGPACAHHAGCLISNVLYIHGGVENKNSNTPSNKLYSMDLQGGLWQEIRCSGSPALSHHTCVVLENRYVMLIGGWNGKRRSCEVFLYDILENCWIPGKAAGFPAGGGLSSHSANLLSNGDIIIIGREGSLRTQRRSGQAYLLRGSVGTNHWRYIEVPLGIDSRSGHTSHIIGQTLAVFGGRNDKQLELHNGFKGAYKNGKLSCALISHLHLLCKEMHPMKRPPPGRKLHAGASGETAVLYHGGETFDGRAKEPVSQVLVLQLKPKIDWFDLGDSGLGRAGHVMCCTESMLLIHGGFSGKGIVHGDSYLLEVSHSSTT